ncbi:helix-turn-helix transcriptional regulator [Halodesulfovibrio spirochaetisodalis]|uniref:Helix-turn-helix domain-containing protein n=1 Tax=Halodesulfovibrio spirochaetisodalis TaxID=1560234 RepID=A0A1B7X9P0_9BACT|nr:helix-turn-helix domain-containing protein [Halodesulfovibrio spirochaetisodalis]OBQ46057.1 hypothetical protein SP90_14250 [Halodesulfovibrio spirochaetisodalis]
MNARTDSPTSPEYTIQLLRLSQVQEILPVSKSTIWRYIQAGKLPKPKKLGRSALWVKEDVENAVRQLIL